MKILKYLILLLSGLIVLYFAFGLVKPAVSYGHEVSVDAPVEEAWAVSQDESKYDQWLAGFKSIELISGEKGKEGSKYLVVVKPSEDEEDFEMIETVVSVKEFDHVQMVFDSEMMDFEQTISFAETDGKTTIKTDSRVMGKNLVTRSMFAIMETLFGAFSAQEARNIEALKKVIEENTTDYYPAPSMTENAVDSVSE